VIEKIKDGPFKNKLFFDMDQEYLGEPLIIEYFEEGCYKNGILDGKYEIYQEDSKGQKYLMESKNYLNGLIHGFHIKKYKDLSWYFNGLENLEFCFTYKDGELIKESFIDESDLDRGFTKYYKKGKIFKEITWYQVMEYPVDTIHETKYFDDDGKIIDSKKETSYIDVENIY
jgi:antitoxin component YwqK of YwqJK toxin-antitoxin module